MGVVVNNRDAQGNIQTLLELREENNPREQSSHRDWNPDWGSRNKAPGGREFVGDYVADGDVYVCVFDSLAGLEKFET